VRNKTVSVRLDSETLERLGAIAKATDRPRAWLMAHAIPARYVEEQSWQVVAIQKAMKRFQSGEAKFADHEQVEGWLESWETTSEGDPPKCTYGNRC